MTSEFLARTQRLVQIWAPRPYRHHYSNFKFGGGTQEMR